ncbi:group I truncated hemoglobin [Streptacidiphilus carbonis]|uniref:group I truncated hemoglobin n=1 Tax=Streptacidiphilus carbonis TaxID=105422 RepID=UPI0005AAEF04|nr:group 1 truncated hemoglobin [Streptacidiphilus carbonis]
MTIYESIGGEAAVTAAVDDFYRRVLADPALAGFFGSTPLPQLKAHQRAFIGAALGGPEAYRGRPMAEVHAGRGITDEHFDAVVGHLAATLASLGVPERTIGEIAAALAPLRAEITV